MNKANAVDVLHNLCDPSLTKKVITNEYLLTQILKRVNYFQLPELRLVNRQWNKSILNLFRQITVPEYPPKTFFCKCFSVVDPEKFTKFNSMQYSFSCYFKKILIHTHNLKTLQLSEMNLNSNQLESLFEQPFMGNLERLELGDNVYSNDMNFNLFPSKIEQLLIQYCPNVKHLALPYNFLKSLNNVDSKWTAFCRRLKSIKIDDVDFLEIPQNIEPLNELEVFDVEYSQIPEQIWKTLNYYMPNLQKLYVSDSSFRYMSLKKSFPKFNNLVELYLYDFVDPLNDIIKMVGQRYGTTLKVLGLCEFCLCDGISEDTLNQFTELQFFQHCRKSSPFDVEFNHGQWFLESLTAFGSLPKLHTFESHLCVLPAEFSLNSLIERGTRIRTFILKVRRGFGGYAIPHDFKRLADRYPNELFTVSLSKAKDELDDLYFPYETHYLLSEKKC